MNQRIVSIGVVGFCIVCLLGLNSCIISTPQPALMPDSASTQAPDPTSSQPDSSTVAPTESRLIITDEVRIEPLDNEGLFIDYPNIDKAPCSELRDIPFTRYGFYLSESFFLEADSAIKISFESDCPIGSNVEGCDFSGGVWLEIEYIDDPETCVTGSVGSFESCNVRRLPSGDSWETECVYRTDRNGFYMVELTNESGESVFCEYHITTCE